MLVIRADLVDAMVAHARADHPDEACGVLAGPEGSDRPERHIAMVNAERRRRSTGSTPASSSGCGGQWKTPARPRSSSITRTPRPRPTRAAPTSRIAAEPDAHYVLVSTRDPDEHELRSYRIVDGVVTEEPVKIVEQYSSSSKRGASP